MGQIITYSMYRRTASFMAILTREIIGDNTTDEGDVAELNPTLQRVCAEQTNQIESYAHLLQH